MDELDGDKTKPWFCREPTYDYTKNCTVLDGDNDMKWVTVDCSDTSDKIPVCEYPHAPSDTFIADTTGMHALHYEFPTVIG